MAAILSLGALGTGTLAYWGFLHRGEHFLYPTKYLQVFLLTVAATAVFLASSASLAYRDALASAARLAGVFLFAVCTNCAFYRLFLNPLNKFPGPYFARLTKFNHVIQNRKLDAHLVLLDMHNKYGKIVRIGPNDLSVIDADGVEVISSPKSKCTKAPWYALETPLNSLHTTRDRGVHDRRRRVWAPAFSDKALRGYESRVQALNDLLVSKLVESKGKPINATNILNLYSFDTMGDLAFGRDFGMLESGEVHWAIKLLNEGMDPLGFEFPGWFFRLLLAIPGAAAGHWKFVDFCTKQLQDRIAVHGKTDPNKPDITHALIDHYQESDNKKSLWSMLCADTRLIIVAGSDTTAATLTYLFYHIADKQEWQKKLRDELQEIRTKNKLTGRVFPDQYLKEAPLLNSIINETMRLNPPVPSGVFRKTPLEGVRIGEAYIPGNTVIQMPQYVMSRSEDNYVEPTEFIPSRFSSKPDLIKHKDAFAPFSTGPYGCIGKNLAYMEIRTITSQIIDQFDVSLAPGEDGQQLLMRSVDHFTLGLEPLNLVFRERK